MVRSSRRRRTEDEYEEEAMEIMNFKSGQMEVEGEDGGDMDMPTKRSEKKTLNEDDYDYVIVFALEEDTETKCCGLIQTLNERNVDQQHRIKQRLRNAGLICNESKSRDGDELFLRITAPVERLEEEAERCEFKMSRREEYGGYYTVFSRDNKHELVGTGDPDMIFSSSERSQLIHNIIEGRLHHGGAKIDVQAMLEDGTFAQIYPLHEEAALNDLLECWPKAWRQPQPLEKIRYYFGEKIALYFAWLGFYTKWLVVPGILGLIMFMYQIIGGEYDNKYVPWFCVLLAFWATFYLEFWKRRNAELSFLWGVQDFEEEERPRPQYHGTSRISPITGKRETFYPSWKRWLKYVASMQVVICMVMVVLISVVAILIIRVVLIERVGSVGGPVAGAMNAVVINMLNAMYQKVALYLNNWENHRTETEFEDQLIAKTFLFQFVNSYIILYYIAFFKGRFELLDGVKEECENGDCMAELAVQLGSIFVTQIIIGNIKEVAVPFFVFKLKVKLEDMALQKGSDGGKKISKAELQSKLEVYESVFDDYNEMVIQFGYVCLFAVAFPIAPTAALLNNLIEIRSDAFKLCTGFQRPVYMCAEDMGTWYNILELMSILAVVTNCAIVGFTSKAFAHLDVLSRLWMVVIAEHLILGIKYFISVVVPDQPGWVTVEEERLRFLEEHDGVDEEEEDDEETESEDEGDWGEDDPFDELGSDDEMDPLLYR